METLSELRKRLLADGQFDEQDVQTLRQALYADFSEKFVYICRT